MQRLPQTTISELRTRLQSGIVHFAFQTKNGNIRFAMGTTNLSHIPSDSHPKGNTPSPKVLPFYDLDIQGWRSVSIEKIVYG
jgi:hypothetical protein